MVSDDDCERCILDGDLAVIREGRTDFYEIQKRVMTENPLKIRLAAERHAKLCLENRFFRDCIKRSYYVIFYAIKSVLALERTDFKRHKDVGAYFNKTYVASEEDA